MSNTTATVTFLRTRHSEGLRLNINGKSVAIGADRHTNPARAEQDARALLAKHAAKRGLQVSATVQRWSDRVGNAIWSIVANLEPITQAEAAPAATTTAEAAPAPSVVVTHDAIAAIIDRDDLTFEQTPLTPAQRDEAERRLAALIQGLIDANIHRLGSIALTDARA